MNPESKLKNQRDLEHYLEEKNVYDIFEDMMKTLIIRKPEKPLNFLINHLAEQESKKIFLVGPPGHDVKKYALEICETDDLKKGKFSCLSVGDLLKREVSKKSDIGQQIEQSIKNFRYVDDEIVINIVLNVLEKEKTNIILEGFPKTRRQGLALQKMGIIPNNFIILNLQEDKLIKGCIHKLYNGDGYYSFIKEEDRERLGRNYATEYSLNINQVKEIYREKFYQVDAEREEILEDIALLLKHKPKRVSMKTAAKIWILGPPGSGRTTLAKALAKKYRMVFISTAQLLADYIAKQGEKANREQDQLLNGELVQDELITRLVLARMDQKDAQMQGYVLDGFPKTEKQLLSLGKSGPSHIFILECNDSLVAERISQRKIDPLTGSYYSNQEEIEDEDLRSRLQVLPLYREANVSKRLSRWKTMLNSIQMLNNNTKYSISATLPPQNILEKVSFHLENSII